MKLLRRHKYVLTLLAVYWPAIFIVTHMPVPQMVRRSGMSDKTMHFVVYMVLAFSLWYSVSPYKKVNFGSIKTWIVLGIIAFYGIMDETLQMLVGRGADVRDFYFNIQGALFGLIVMGIFDFWPSLLIIGSALIFIVTNISRLSTLCNSPPMNAAFHFFAYAVLTLIWIQLAQRYFRLRQTSLKWLAIAVLPPVGYLAFVKICSVLLGKTVWYIDIFVACAGIIMAAVTSWLVCAAGSRQFSLK